MMELTDDEIAQIWGTRKKFIDDGIGFARAIEARVLDNLRKQEPVGFLYRNNTRNGIGLEPWYRHGAKLKHATNATALYEHAAPMPPESITYCGTETELIRRAALAAPIPPTSMEEAFQLWYADKGCEISDDPADLKKAFFEKFTAPIPPEGEKK